MYSRSGAKGWLHKKQDLVGPERTQLSSSVSVSGLSLVLSCHDSGLINLWWKAVVTVVIVVSHWLLGENEVEGSMENGYPEITTPHVYKGQLVT